MGSFEGIVCVSLKILARLNRLLHKSGREGFSFLAFSMDSLKLVHWQQQVEGHWLNRSEKAQQEDDQIIIQQAWISF